MRVIAAQCARAAWQPAPLYVVDVGEVDDELCMLEINPFSGADLYLCDPAAVIDAASRVARRIFDEEAASP